VVLQQRERPPAAVAAPEPGRERLSEQALAPVILRLYPAASDLARGRRLTAAMLKQGSIKIVIENESS